MKDDVKLAFLIEGRPIAWPIHKTYFCQPTNTNFVQALIMGIELFLV